MIKFIVFGILAAIDAIASVYDVSSTEKGIKRGVGVEGNEVVTTLARTDKPGSLFLYLWNFGFITLIAALGSFVNNPAVTGFSIAVLAVDAAKHVIGGYKWNVLLRGGTLPTETTAWQKFLGLGR
jgi:hypothetical protein